MSSLRYFTRLLQARTPLLGLLPCLTWFLLPTPRAARLDEPTPPASSELSWPLSGYWPITLSWWMSEPEKLTSHVSLQCPLLATSSVCVNVSRGSPRGLQLCSLLGPGHQFLPLSLPHVVTLQHLDTKSLRDCFFTAHHSTIFLEGFRPQNLGDPSASASLTLQLQMCAAISTFCVLIYKEQARGAGDKDHCFLSQ